MIFSDPEANNLEYYLDFLDAIFGAGAEWQQISIIGLGSSTKGTLIAAIISRIN